VSVSLFYPLGFERRRCSDRHRRSWVRSIAPVIWTSPVSKCLALTGMSVMARASATKSLQSHRKGPREEWPQARILACSRGTGVGKGSEMWLLRQWKLLAVGMAIGIGLGIASARYELPAGLNFERFVYYPNCISPSPAPSSPPACCCRHCRDRFRCNSGEACAAAHSVMDMADAVSGAEPVGHRHRIFAQLARHAAIENNTVRR
jgi:hypothetical protein